MGCPYALSVGLRWRVEGIRKRQDSWRRKMGSAQQVSASARKPFHDPSCCARDWANDKNGSAQAVRPAVVDVDVTTGHQKNREAILLPIKMGDHCFIPLVRKSLALVCELDILFLRNDAPGSLVKSGGDLDNRIKTLFDGLRMPTLDELKVGAPDADPCYCLLENDDLISGFSVRTDRLLTDPNRSESRVLLVIEVKLTALRLTTQNVGFLTD